MSFPSFRFVVVLAIGLSFVDWIVIAFLWPFAGRSAESIWLDNLPAAVTDIVIRAAETHADRFVGPALPADDANRWPVARDIESAG
jgi:hypothetical protein